MSLHPAPPDAARPARAALVALLGAGVGAGLLFLGWTAYTAPPKAAPPPLPRAAAPAQPAPSVAMVRPLPMPRDRQVSARRGPDGHFYFDTSVDGTGVRMLFDTGASVVVLTSEDAERIGVALGSLDYSIVTRTANGTSDAAPVMLASLRVGDIVRRNVQAMVVRPGKLQTTLLGQSFMSRLGGYRYERSELILLDE